MPVWIIGKNSMKHHYQRKKNYSHLNTKYITNADYTPAKTVCKGFKTTKLDNYDLYVQTDTVLLANVFNNFQNICLVI